MDIRIDEKYRLASGRRNVILVEEKIAQDGIKKGEKYDTQVGFYASVEQALKGYKRLKVNTSNATSVNQLVKELKAIDKTIEKMMEDE